MNTAKKIIAPGYYNARPSNWGIKTVGEKQTLVAFVTLSITDGALEGTTVTYDGYLTEKAMERTLKNLRVMGFNDNTLDKFNGGPFEAALDSHTPVRINVKEEQYNGKNYTKVVGIYSPKEFGKPVSRSMLPDITGTMLALKAEANEGAMKGGSDDLPF